MRTFVVLASGLPDVTSRHFRAYSGTDLRGLGMVPAMLAASSYSATGVFLSLASRRMAQSLFVSSSV